MMGILLAIQLSSDLLSQIFSYVPLSTVQELYLWERGLKVKISDPEFLENRFF